MSSKANWIGKLGVGAVAAGLALAPAQAWAEGPVSNTGKGIAGGALLGAEVVMITTAIIGAEDIWPYLVFGAVGAGGGAAGGYFLEDGVTEPEPALYMFAGGMALIVPTIVAMLNATAYSPDEDLEEGEIETEDKPASPAKAPGAAPGAVPGGGAPASPVLDVKTGARRPYVPLSFVGFDASKSVTSIHAGVPAVQVRPMFSLEEISRYGVAQETEVHVPVMSGRF